MTLIFCTMMGMNVRDEHGVDADVMNCVVTFIMYAWSWHALQLSKAEPKVDVSVVGEPQDVVLAKAYMYRYIKFIMYCRNQLPGQEVLYIYCSPIPSTRMNEFHTIMFQRFTGLHVHV